MTDIVIVAAARTAVGKFGGSLAKTAAPELGATVIKALLQRSGLSGEQIGEVILGQVLTAGSGQNPARQSVIKSGLPQGVPGMTINKVCGSGLKAVMLAAQAIRDGDSEIVIAGGQENMSMAPHVLLGSRDGQRMGDWKMIDSMITDGLWDVYNQYHMGITAENVAKKYGVTREMQDALALGSQQKAAAAQEAGRFKDEIVGVTIPQKKGDPLVVTEDEGPPNGKPEKFASLRPAFSKDGTITAANASSINDGASALVLASEAAVKAHKLEPLGRIVGYAGAAQAPEWFTTAPAAAIKNTTTKLGISAKDIDLFEINEAFAVVAMVVSQLCELDPKTVNVRGGAVALGHPIGASGARILTTLLYTMKAQNKSRGLATLCIGGGEGLALVVER